MRHAYELVRIERAHNKNITDTLKTMEANLNQARNDITGNLEETKAIRSWLGYETQELYGKIERIAKSVLLYMSYPVKPQSRDRPQQTPSHKQFWILPG